MGTSNDQKRFTYNGKVFVPVRKFTKEENDLAFMLPLTQDLELGFSKYNWHKGDAYDYDAFYEAANSDMDIFLCVQTGKYYIPSDNELLIYDDCFITYKN